MYVYIHRHKQTFTRIYMDVRVCVCTRVSFVCMLVCVCKF